MNKTITYRLEGIKGIELTNVDPLLIVDDYIESFYLDVKLDKLYIKLKKEVDFEDVYNHINDFAHRISMSLLLINNIDIGNPRIFLEQTGVINVNISAKIDFIKIEINDDGIFCNQLFDYSKSLQVNDYAILRTIELLKIDDRIIQFMGLYNLILELVPIGKQKSNQKIVVNFFKNNREKYGIRLLPSTRYDTSDDVEDELTQIRNEIAHQDRIRDINKIQSISEKITPRLMQKMIMVISDLSKGKYATTHNTPFEPLRRLHYESQCKSGGNYNSWAQSKQYDGC